MTTLLIALAVYFGISFVAVPFLGAMIATPDPYDQIDFDALEGLETPESSLVRVEEQVAA